MKRPGKIVPASIVIASIAAFSAAADLLPIQTVSFLAKTNRSVIKVDGKNAKPLLAKVTVAGNIVQALETEVSPNDLETGLSIRDKHMREEVFQLKDGSTPSVKFRLTAPLALSGSPVKAQGVLSIRGKEAPFAPTCTGSVAGTKVKADCTGDVALADHGIEQPSNMGIKVQPTVQLTIAADGELKAEGK